VINNAFVCQFKGIKLAKSVKKHAILNVFPANSRKASELQLLIPEIFFTFGYLQALNKSMNNGFLECPEFY